jgi:DNA polymerase epsilon subunit 1
MPTSIINDETGDEHSAIDYYMVQDTGDVFKATFMYEPYFLIFLKTKNSTIRQEVRSASVAM